MAIRIETTTGIPLFMYPQSRAAMYDNSLFVTKTTSPMKMKAQMADLKANLAIDPNIMADVQYWGFNSTGTKKYFLVAVFTLNHSRMQIFFTRGCLTWVTNSTYTIRYDANTQKARVIQCTVRKWAKGRLEARRLTVAMALHARLGASSKIQALGSDLLGFVLRTTMPSECAVPCPA